jgi:hypothetical protein
MRKNKLFLIFLLVLISIACQVSVDMSNSSPAATSIPAATSTPNPTPSSNPQPAIPDGWLTYQNTHYGFEIFYPPNYQAMDDNNSLYGWTNGVVLLYNGGQSFDIAIQAWDNQAELDANYPDQSHITTMTNGGKIISIFDVTQDPENAAIIATFHLIP